MKTSRTHNTSHQYYLSLSDGCSWALSGIDKCGGWVDKFAGIMELEETRLNGSPELIFCSSGQANEILDQMTNASIHKRKSSGDGNSWYFHDHNSLRIWYHNNIPDIVCELKDIRDPAGEFINMWFALLPIFKKSIFRGGLPFHAGLVEWGGRGFLLAAPGDTGKTTCCQRFPRPWQPLCDDETLVVSDKEKKYRAHPFPTWSDYLWKRSDKTWNIQYSVPLFGVFFLEQSETDAIERLGEGRAAVLMTESATQVCNKFWKKSSEENQRLFRRELFNNACEIARKIPAYRLCVSLDGRFWEKMGQAIGL